MYNYLFIGSDFAPLVVTKSIQDMERPWLKLMERYVYINCKLHIFIVEYSQRNLLNHLSVIYFP